MAGERIKTELDDMKRDPPLKCTVEAISDDLNKWSATILGPESSPYEGGTFFLDIEFPPDYPSQPPKLTFTTKIYHPNVDENGRIGLNILGESWSPNLTVEKLLLSIDFLMSQPEPTGESALMSDIAEQYQTDKDNFDKTAREWTRKYAMKKSTE